MSVSEICISDRARSFRVYRYSIVTTDETDDVFIELFSYLQELLCTAFGVGCITTAIRATRLHCGGASI